MIKEKRPWGYYENILEGDKYKVKRIVINPDQAISLQLHDKRSEYWVIVEGEGIMTLGDYSFEVSPGVSLSIEKREIHRVKAKSFNQLVIIETQLGECSEEDITRLEDEYGRG